MKTIKRIIIVVLVLSAVAAGGYRLGSHKGQDAEFRIQDSGSKIAALPARKILYYRNPMGLPDTSPVPKKDAMGMDYVAVYDGDAPREDGAVSISVEKVQKLGVKSEAAVRRILAKIIHATGRVEVDERRTYAIAPKFEGWVERLYVNSTGQAVRKGQPLFDVYSPELVSVQREYALALRGEAALANADEETRNSMKQLADASLARLKNWDMEANGQPRRNLTFVSPASGIVLEKKAVQGMRFMPGEALYQIADLSVVWVLADVNEQDIAQVKVGSKVQVNIGAYPDKQFEGKIAFIYPTLNAATRTVQVRVEIANKDGRLMPAMFANVTLPTDNGVAVLTVPTSAVIDSGTRQIVLVQLAEGRFAPRTVRLGRRGDDYVEVLGGITEGEQVVTSALFLIDAESNLKAALAGLGADEAHAVQSAATPDAAVATPARAKPKAAGVGHQATGILNSINADGTVSITHEAIATLGWPGMTMDFALANSSLAAGIKPGAAISFELVERKPDEWVITRLQARAQHGGH
ncbi:MAG: efflux RND transporter periplasmic adaptor subunit [Gallionella sp.]|nr:efflux RND transporter periplasmic adaptor subunit [Gallionella sp.]